MLNRTFSPFPILTTERLTLRQLQIFDGREIFALRSDSEINRYLDRQMSKTVDDARNFINAVNEHFIKNDALYWAITLRDKNKLVGIVCFLGFSDNGNKCEIGYELLREFQGQGIMREAVKKVIDYAFNTIKVQKIEAYFHRDNERSEKLLRKLSFRPANEPGTASPGLLCYYLAEGGTYRT